MSAEASNRSLFDDPITLQVMWNRLIFIADQADSVLGRTAFSPIVRENHDYVTVLMPRKYPDPRKPGAEYFTTWFDTWRFVNGKADEHWDPATIAPPAAK